MHFQGVRGLSLFFSTPLNRGWGFHPLPSPSPSGEHGLGPGFLVGVGVGSPAGDRSFGLFGPRDGLFEGSWGQASAQVVHGCCGLVKAPSRVAGHRTAW